MHRAAALAVVFTALCHAAGSGREPAAKDAKPAKAARVLPGAEADGGVRLPNQWAIRPAGRQLELGDFPVSLALHPGGKWLAALHAGYGPHEIIIVGLE